MTSRKKPDKQFERTLFDPPAAKSPTVGTVTAKARRTDPPTSHAAAAQLNTGGKLTERLQFALAAVRRDPGLTCKELAQAINLERHNLQRRLSELHGAGWIVKGRSRTCRVLGKSCVTWLPATIDTTTTNLISQEIKPGHQPAGNEMLGAAAVEGDCSSSSHGSPAPPRPGETGKSSQPAAVSDPPGTTPASNSAVAVPMKPCSSPPCKAGPPRETSTGSAAERMTPEMLCPIREHRRFWKSIHGATVCGECHPPVSPSIVAAWLDAGERPEPIVVTLSKVRASRTQDVVSFVAELTNRAPPDD